MMSEAPEAGYSENCCIRQNGKRMGDIRNLNRIILN